MAGIQAHRNRAGKIPGKSGAPFPAPARISRRRTSSPTAWSRLSKSTGNTTRSKSAVPGSRPRAWPDRGRQRESPSQASAVPTTRPKCKKSAARRSRKRSRRSGPSHGPTPSPRGHRADFRASGIQSEPAIDRRGGVIMSDVGIAPAPPQHPQPLRARHRGADHDPAARRPAGADRQPGSQQAADRAATVRESACRRALRQGRRATARSTPSTAAWATTIRPSRWRRSRKDRPQETAAEGRRPPRAEHGHFAPGTARRPRRASTPPTARRHPDSLTARTAPSRLPAGNSARPHQPVARPRALPRAAAADGAARQGRVAQGARERARRGRTACTSEMADAYQRFRGDHEEMNGIRQFQQMAREHGTTLQRALSNYTTMEKKLCQRPLRGVRHDRQQPQPSHTRTGRS